MFGGNSTESDYILQGNMYFAVVSKFPGIEFEPSISNLTVNNQDSSFVYSRRNYHQLPWFTAGDRIFVDQDIRCFSLPPSLRAASVLAIQTSYYDSDVPTVEMIQFDMQQSGYVFICIDASIPHHFLPSWLTIMNFKRTDMTLSAGPEGTIKFSVFSFPLSLLPSLSLTPYLSTFCRTRRYDKILPLPKELFRSR